MGEGRNVYHPSPNLVRRIHPTERIAAVVATLREEGITVTRALAGTGLKAGDLRAVATRVSYRQVATVFRNATELSRDPAIAFRAGRRMHVDAYGMYGYALLSSPTRAEGIDFTAKYGRALGMVAEVAFTRDEDTATYRFRAVLSRNPLDEVYRFALEFAFAGCQTLCKDLYGQPFRFTRLRAAYPAPPNARVYKRIFQCPVLFDQDVNEVEFDARWIDHPLVRPHPMTHAMAGDLCGRFLDGIDCDGGVVNDVRRILIENPGHFPRIEAMAAKFSLHPRALRRRLEAEGTSYRELVAEVRMKLAIEYLRHTEMTNEEIAVRLDYSDAANFRHAFTRWTGKSPSEYRES